MTRQRQPSPRRENSRPRRQRYAYFTLDDIKRHADESFSYIENLQIPADHQEQQSILRLKVIMAESILDFYIHELCKYCITAIYKDELPENDKYSDLKVPIKTLKLCLKASERDPDNLSWLLEAITELQSRNCYMSFKALLEALKLCGINPEDVWRAAFGSEPSAVGFLGKTYRKRNEIAHQASRSHATAEENALSIEEAQEITEKLHKLIDTIHGQIPQPSSQRG